MAVQVSLSLVLNLYSQLICIINYDRICLFFNEAGKTEERHGKIDR